MKRTYRPNFEALRQHIVDQNRVQLTERLRRTFVVELDDDALAAIVILIKEGTIIIEHDGGLWEGNRIALADDEDVPPEIKRAIDTIFNRYL